MRNNPELVQKYDDTITDQREKGIIEKVGSEPNSLIKQYIPHHTVVNPTNATTMSVYTEGPSCYRTCQVFYLGSASIRLA